MTVTFVGTYVLASDFGETTVKAAMTDWSSAAYFNRTAKGRRQYYAGSWPSSPPQYLLDDITAGRRVSMSFKPSVVANSSSPSAQNQSDKASLKTFLDSCVSAGLSATVAIWHEPYPQNLTTSQYANTVRYYGPTIRSHYWLAHCQASYAIANGTINVSDYFNACDANSFDLIAGDIYAPAYVLDNGIVGKFQTLADNNSLPLAVWEFNGHPGTGSGTQTNTQITNFFNNIKNTFGNRLSANKPCGDILFFDHDDGTPNCTFVASSSDFRVPLIQQIYDTMNGQGTTLVITTGGLPGGTQGTAYSQTVQSSGGTPPNTWSITSGALPTGLSIGSSTGTISGTPSAAGTFTFNVHVADSASHTANKSFTVTIASNLAITTTSPLAGATQNSAYTTTLAASGGTSPYTWAATGTPAGLSLSSGGVLSGTPTTPGSYTIAVTVTDSLSSTATKNLALTITASSGTQQTVTLTSGTSFTGPSNTTTLDSIELWGAGASGAGPATTTGQAGGGGGGGAYAKWTAVACTAGSSNPVSIGAGGVERTGATGQAGGATSITIGGVTYTANGGSGGVSGTGGTGGGGGAGGAASTTPAGVTSFAGGTGANGTAATGPAGGGGSSAGTAANGNNGTTGTGGTAPTGGFAGGNGGTTGSQNGVDAPGLAGGGGGGFWDGTFHEHSGAGGGGQIVIKYTPTGSANPSITTASLPAATQGVAYTATLAATGGATPYTWSLAAGTLPAGLTLSTAGVLSGTPTTAGSTALTFQVTDAASATATATLTLTVSTSLVIVTTSLLAATFGEDYEFQLTAGGGAPPYTWTVTSLPDGLTMNLGGDITGNTTSLGAFQVPVTVTDSLGATASATLELDVLAPGSSDVYADFYTDIYGQIFTPPPPGPAPPPVRPPIVTPWRFLFGPPQPTGGWTGEIRQSQQRQLQLRAGPTNTHQCTVNIDARSPEAAAILEMQTDFQVMWGDSLIFAGRVGPAQDDLDAAAHRVQFTATDYRDWFRRRNIAPSPDETVTDDAAALIWFMANGIQIESVPGDPGGGYPGGNMGITRGTNQVVGQSVTFTMSQGDYVGDDIDQICQMFGTGSISDPTDSNFYGMDWDVTPYASSDLRLDIFYPRRGVSRGVVLEYGGGLVASITRVFDPSTYADAIMMTGDSSKSLTPKELTAANISNLPQGRWDKVLGSSIKTQQSLNNRANWELMNAQVLLPTYTVTLHPGVWQGPDHIWLGDTVQLRIGSGRLNVDTPLQVSEMDFDVSADGIETLTLTLGRVPFRLHQQIPKMLRRLRYLESR